MKPRLYEVAKKVIEDLNIEKMADSIENQFEDKLKKSSVNDLNSALFIGVRIKNFNFNDLSFEVEDVEFFREGIQLPENIQTKCIKSMLSNALIKIFKERNYLCFVTKHNDKNEAEEIFVGFSMLSEDCIPIEMMDLSVRAYNSIKRAGCNTYGEIIQKFDCYETLLKARNIGKPVADEIVEKVRIMGCTAFCSDREN